MKKFIYAGLLSITTLISLPLAARIVNPTSESNYYELLNNQSVIVDFYADWCAPCKKLSSTLDALHEKYPNMTLVKVDLEQYPTFGTKYNLRSIPALYFFSQGIQLSVVDPATHKSVKQIIGLRTLKELETIIKNVFDT